MAATAFQVILTGEQVVPAFVAADLGESFRDVTLLAGVSGGWEQCEDGIPPSYYVADLTEPVIVPDAVLDLEAADEAVIYLAASSDYTVTTDDDAVTVFARPSLALGSDGMTMNGPDDDCDSADGAVTLYRDLASDELIVVSQDETFAAAFLFADEGSAAVGSDSPNLFYFVDDAESVTLLPATQARIDSAIVIP